MCTSAAEPANLLAAVKSQLAWHAGIKATHDAAFRFNAMIVMQHYNTNRNHEPLCYNNTSVPAPP